MIIYFISKDAYFYIREQVPKYAFSDVLQLFGAVWCIFTHNVQ